MMREPIRVLSVFKLVFALVLMGFIGLQATGDRDSTGGTESLSPGTLSAGDGDESHLDIRTTVLFSELDGSEFDEDGTVDGVLTVSKLKIKDDGALIIDVLTASVISSGEIKIEKRGAVRSDKPPSVGPDLLLQAGKKFDLKGDAIINVDGLDVGGRLRLCAAEDLKIRDKAVVSASGLNGGSVGGSIEMESARRVRIENKRGVVRANGDAGGTVTLISCSDKDDAINFKKRTHVQAIGTNGAGGLVEAESRLGGINLDGDDIIILALGSTVDGTVRLTAATTVEPKLPPTDPPAQVITGVTSEDPCDCTQVPTGDLVITITAPPNGFITADLTIDVSGDVGGATSVEVNGVDAVISGATFTAADVPIHEGTNTIVATASNDEGDTATDSISVRRDTDPPRIVFETPRDGDRFVVASIPVAGTVSDIIPGGSTNSDDVVVTVNGVTAEVNNRTFFIADLPLTLGSNMLTAVATDVAGNVGTSTIIVTREENLSGVRVLATGGNAQSGPINGTLPEPLSVSVRDQNGNPLPNRPVTFMVSRGDGLLGDPGNNQRSRTLLADATGNASLPFTLGSRTGQGFHRVRVTTPGSLTFAEFCATSENLPPASIAIVMIPPRQAPAGQELTQPIAAKVTDAGGNAIDGAIVTFAVEFGGGSFNGQPTRDVPTNPDGIAEAFWTLGDDAGVANNEVSATFASNLGLPATFIVSGLSTGAVEDTTVGGTVQNSVGGPIVGAKVVLRDTTLEAFTEPDGTFTIVDVPPGGYLVAVLGSEANDPDNGIFFPDIEFDIEAVAGAANTLDQIVVLPFLDMDGAQLAGGDEDVVLTMAGVPDFAIRVFANSTFVHDPDTGELVQQAVVMSSSQVKFDKVPMPPPEGSTPMVVGTLQPPGIILDPPAQVTYPNAEGFAPGDVADVFAFHHDIGQFVNIGPGTVAEDASVVVSDPGFGIVQSGWHCLIRLPGDGAQCANECSAKLEWQAVKANGTLGPVKTTAPVVLSCTDGDSRKAKLKVTFTPAGGSFDATNWTGGTGAVTLTEASTAGNVSRVTAEATADFEEAMITSPLYRIMVPDQPDKTCQAEVTIEPGDIEFLDNMNTKIPSDGSLQISNFLTTSTLPATSAFAATNVDPDNFRIEVKDPGAAGASVQMKLEVLTGGTVQRTINYTLDKKMDTTFRGEFLRLVSDTVDDAASGGGPTTDPKNQTILAKLDDTIRLTYTSAAGDMCMKQTRVCRPASESGANAVRRAVLDIRIGFIDADGDGVHDAGEEVVPPATVQQEVVASQERWAQACVRYTAPDPAGYTYFNLAGSLDATGRFQLSDPNNFAGIGPGGVVALAASAPAGGTTTTIYYVPQLDSGAIAEAYPPQRLKVATDVEVVAGRAPGAGQSQANSNTVFIGTISGDRFDLAHEMGHILLNTNESGQPATVLFPSGLPQVNNNVNAAKRLSTSQAGSVPTNGVHMHITGFTAGGPTRQTINNLNVPVTARQTRVGLTGVGNTLLQQ